MWFRQFFWAGKSSFLTWRLMYIICYDWVKFRQWYVGVPVCTYTEVNITRWLLVISSNDFLYICICFPSLWKDETAAVYLRKKYIKKVNFLICFKICDSSLTCWRSRKFYLHVHSLLGRTSSNISKLRQIFFQYFQNPEAESNDFSFRRFEFILACNAPH